MVLLAQCFLLASAPAIFILWLFHRRDRWDPEPKLLVLGVFVLGALCAVPAYFLQAALPGPDGAAYELWVKVGLVEELFKLLPLLWVVWRRPEFDEPMDGIVYGVAGALGFATLENAVYTAHFGAAVLVHRAFTATLAHVGLSGLVGYHVGKARFGHGGWWQVVLAFLAVVALHGAYDWLLIVPLAARGTVAVMVPVLLLLLCWAARKADRLSPFRARALDEA